MLPASTGKRGTIERALECGPSNNAMMMGTAVLLSRYSGGSVTHPESSGIRKKLQSVTVRRNNPHQVSYQECRFHLYESLSGKAGKREKVFLV